MSKTIWIDTETTGTDPSKNGLIQIAALVEIDGQIKERIAFKVKPFEGDEITDKALEVNGLTREEIREFDAPKDVHVEFVAILSKYIDQYDRLDKFIVAGYNTQFDLDFLREFWSKNGDNYFGSFFYHKPIDVDEIVVLINRLKGELPRYAKLIDALRRFGIEPPEDLHDAMADIVYTRKLYVAVMKVLKNTMNEISGGDDGQVET